MRSGVILIAVIALAGAATASDSERGRSGPVFHGKSERITGDWKRKIVGSSWRPGCPTPLRRLRLLTVSHWDFKGDVERGRLVVHRGHDREVLKVMRVLFRKRFPIRRMHLIDRYGADDRRSMRHDNTSAFNRRFVGGRRAGSGAATGTGRATTSTSRARAADQSVAAKASRKRSFCSRVP